jgi:hypothetical protein
LKVQEVEEKITTRIAGLEDQENRLQEWLECIREVGEIAKKMGYTRSPSQGEEGSLMKAFEQLVDQAEGEEPAPEVAAAPEATAEAAEPEEDESVEQPEVELASTGELEAVESDERAEVEQDAVELASTEKMESLSAAEPAQEAAEEKKVLVVPDEENLDQLRASLSRSQDDKTNVKNRFGSIVSSLFSADED